VAIRWQSWPGQRDGESARADGSLEETIAELERGVLDAVKGGAFKTADTLSKRIEDRRAELEALRREAAGVVELSTRRR